MDTAIHTPERPDDVSVRRLVRETVAHSKAYLSAEKEALTLRAKLTVVVARNAAVFGMAAGVLALFGFGWMLVAAAEGLSELVHPAWAALIVAVALMLTALLCVRLATGALRGLPKGSS